MITRPWRSGAGYAAGAVMFGLGVKEALRVGRGSIDDARTSARHVGTARIAAGALMLARPLVLPKMLGLDDAGPALRWLPRLLGIREIAVGVAAVAASSRTENPLPWLCTLGAIDGAESIVVFAGVVEGAVPPARGWPFIASDLGSALAGVGAAAQLSRRRANTSTAGTA